MGTRGIVGIKHDSKSIFTYNHYDSYPSWLGVRMIEFVQNVDLDALPGRIASLKQVDESDRPSPEQLADLKERGFWQNVSSGDDWYAALRNAQGNLGAYIDAGYITPAEDYTQAGDCSIEYAYLVDLDAGELVSYAYSSEGAPMREIDRQAFDDLLTEGFDAQEHMSAVEAAL